MLAAAAAAACLTFDRLMRCTSSVGRATVAALSSSASSCLSRSALWNSPRCTCSSMSACWRASSFMDASYLGGSGRLNQGDALMPGTSMRESCLTSNILSSRSFSSGVRRSTALLLLGRSRQLVLICCSQMSYRPAVLLKLSSCVSKGNMPASMTNSSTPAAQTSTFLPSYPVRELMSSGPMYSGVPMRMVSMLELACQCLAKPKSHSFSHGGLWWSSKVLSSLRSLCATLFLWQYSTAEMSCRK
mmetsp:Transcript_13647/g.33574  ORF Transcript_13647/g.33574 Transcript_13647/m.33574 type:complete len:245 (-) Transcript_13647:799-1533(-)